MGLALALSACNFTDDTPTYRYRLKVEVETPEGLKSGSSVIEVNTGFGRSPMAPSSRALRFKVRGEAAAVDLGERGVLFALLRSENEVEWASHVMFLLTPQVTSSDGRDYEATFAEMLKRRGEIELPRYFPIQGMRRPARPMLVTFGDLDEPTSVEKVAPDNLAATFGEDVELRRITVQLTTDPVTTGIEDQLWWLSEYYSRMLDGQRLNVSNDLANNLTQSDFSKESKK
ncbi:hypothetical protein ACXYN8_08205 [Altererythrobacter sp. CAU 1778]